MITDHFEIGTTVEWLRVRHANSTIEIKKFTGKIDEINGSKAKVKFEGYVYRKTVSLFELKPVEDQI